MVNANIRLKNVVARVNMVAPLKKDRPLPGRQSVWRERIGH
jgi:hypothetical protein